MVSKRHRDHLKAARDASVTSFKKRRSEAGSLSTSDQREIDDNKLSTTDTSDTERDSGTWSWNERSDSDSEKKENDVDERDLEEEHSKTERDASLEVPQKELKWNKEGEFNLRGGYGSGSRSSKKRQKKSARELEKECSKSYDIRALWQRIQKLGILSAANSPGGLGPLSELLPNDHISPACPLSDISRGSASSFSKQQIFKNQQIEALKDLTKLLESIRAKEKKYRDRFSPYSNYYRRHIMVQQFFQAQLTTGPSQTGRSFSCNVARSFGKGTGTFTARNIVRQENLWVNTREIPERKENIETITIFGCMMEI